MTSFLRGIGDWVLGRWRVVLGTAAGVYGVAYVAVRRGFWTRPVRRLLARQILFTGVEALGLVSLVAALAGISVVAQAQLWLHEFGQSAMLGPVLVTVIIREVGPLLVSLIVIGRSGTAMTTELGNMKIRHEVEVLDGLGIDPMVYLAMPRAVGMAASIFSLSVAFTVVSLGVGYGFGVWMGGSVGDPQRFVSAVTGAVTLADVINLLAKTLLTGLIVGTICCMEGLGVRLSVTEVPQATTRAVVRSILVALLLSAAVSVLTYV